MYLVPKYFFPISPLCNLIISIYLSCSASGCVKKKCGLTFLATCQAIDRIFPFCASLQRSTEALRPFLESCWIMMLVHLLALWLHELFAWPGVLLSNGLFVYFNINHSLSYWIMGTLLLLDLMVVKALSLLAMSMHGKRHSKPALVAAMSGLFLIKYTRHSCGII